MRKIALCSLSVLLVIFMAACDTAGTAPSRADEAAEPVQVQQDNGESEATGTRATVTVTTLNAEKEKILLEVPYNPQRVAVMDLAVLDIIDNLGFGDRVVGLSKGTSISYLQDYMTDNSIRNLGTIKEVSLEAVMECEPEIIFIGGRLSSQYEAFSEIAPVVFLSTDVEIGLVNSMSKNATTVASIFGADDQVTGLLADFDTRIAALRDVSEGKTAFVGMLNAGGFNMLGNDGRCSIIGMEIGFENIGPIAEKSERTDSQREATLVTATHGNETSFEYIVRLDPDYIFVMNRDDAIGTEGAETAQEVIENELVMRTTAYRNNSIVYLQHSNVWYTAEGGITAMDYMLQDLESALLA